MLDNKMRETLDKLIGRTVMSFHTVMSSMVVLYSDNNITWPLGHNRQACQIELSLLFIR
jgi:hypothetical protein